MPILGAPPKFPFWRAPGFKPAFTKPLPLFFLEPLPVVQLSDPVTEPLPLDSLLFQSSDPTVEPLPFPFDDPEPLFPLESLSSQPSEFTAEPLLPFEPLPF